MKEKEILNSELYRITIQFEKLYALFSENDQLKSGLIDFNDKSRISTNLFEHRRGLKISILETYEIDFLELINSILSDKATLRIKSLFTEKGTNNYFVAIYGQPDRKNEWGFSIDGPFLSLNFTFKDEDFSSVPMLIGNFKSRLSNGKVSRNPMIIEIGIPSDFMSNLDENQLKVAVVSDFAPDDLIYAYSENLSIIPSGIPISQLYSKGQKTFFGMILTVYMHRLKPNMAQKFRSKLFFGSSKNYKLAWKGGLEESDRFYYSISSPNLIIEFLKVSEGDSDIITVIRDKKYDFGKKFLTVRKQT